MNDSKLYINTGKFLRLNTQINGKIVWFYKNFQQQEYKFLRVDPTLYIPYLKKGHSGIYYCLVYDVENNKNSLDLIELKVYSKYFITMIEIILIGNSCYILNLHKYSNSNVRLIDY